MRSYVSYLRVSTDRQGRSGLGLEAQREAIHRFLQDGRLLREYIEVESGRRTDRPELSKALDHCRDTGAILLIAKLDRLARSVAFISQLMESSIEFIAADFPQANRLTVHLLAAVAEHEREMISRRTREALAAAKARGKLLGHNNLTMDGARKGWTRSAKNRRRSADEFAAKRARVINGYLAEGMSLRAIARRLNEDGLLTARGGRWTATTLRNILERSSAPPDVSAGPADTDPFCDFIPAIQSKSD
jgi:DNA invertase Pin-like site-specific DNA recombinase